jgi:hypothetical protein
MRTRIILTLLLLLCAVWFAQSVGRPVATLARQKAVVATVNGGDQAYVNQHAVDTTVMWPWSAVGVILGVTLIWHAPMRRALAADRCKKQPHSSTL